MSQPARDCISVPLKEREERGCRLCWTVWNLQEVLKDGCRVTWVQVHVHFWLKIFKNKKTNEVKWRRRKIKVSPFFFLSWHIWPEHPGLYSQDFADCLNNSWIIQPAYSFIVSLFPHGESRCLTHVPFHFVIFKVAFPWKNEGLQALQFYCSFLWWARKWCNSLSHPARFAVHFC